MNTRQLYASGKSIIPKTNYEKDKVPEQILEMRELIREITIKIANELLHNDDIAIWAKQLQKPSYTASEVGADASGSASKALDDAKEYANSTYIQATGYTDSAIAALINGAPSTRDTLKEIADAMAENEDVVKALEAAIGTRANEIEFQTHVANKTVHITESEREKIEEIDAIKQSFQNGCNTIAAKITACGVETADNDSPDVMAANIQNIYDNQYNAGLAAGKAAAEHSAYIKLSIDGRDCCATAYLYVDGVSKTSILTGYATGNRNFTSGTITI